MGKASMPTVAIPETKRRRIIPDNIKNFIINERENTTPNYQDKLAVLMKLSFSLANISASTCRPDASTT